MSQTEMTLKIACLPDHISQMEQTHGLGVPPCGHKFICKWVVAVFLKETERGRDRGERREKEVRKERREGGREPRTGTRFQLARLKMCQCRQNNTIHQNLK